MILTAEQHRQLTDEQADKLATLTDAFGELQSIAFSPFDLPPGYVLCVLGPTEFTCGIAPDGVASS